MDSFFTPPVPLQVSRSSSVSGCAILWMRPFNRDFFSSAARQATVIPSKAIVVFLVYSSWWNVPVSYYTRKKTVLTDVFSNMFERSH